jgi:hypothetical protein
MAHSVLCPCAQARTFMELPSGSLMPVGQAVMSPFANGHLSGLFFYTLRPKLLGSWARLAPILVGGYKSDSGKA